jgi:glycine cleavage system H protein
VNPEYLQVTVGKFIFRVKEGLLYTEDGVWFAPPAPGGATRLGLSDFRQQSSGDAAFVELPSVGGIVKAGEALAEIETIKVDLEIILPFEATVSAVNEALGDAPVLINQDPYGTGWLAEVKPAVWSAPGLLDAAAYLAIMTAQAEEAAR